MISAALAWLSLPVPHFTNGTLIALVLIWGACGLYIGSSPLWRDAEDGDE